MLDAIEMNPDGEIRASVIWLHGLGADGRDFVPLVPQLGLSGMGVRFVFPHAFARPVAINGGYRMRAWYDIRWADLRRDVDAPGILQSVCEVQELIERETALGIPANRILLAGFSQGGVIALHAGLTRPSPLAGILALSSYLALPAVLGREASEASHGTPIFMAHGSEDPVVPLALGEAARDYLITSGYVVDFHRYSMPHSVCAEEVFDIGAWVQARLGP
jgi:phospholipase/carboxylesterase